MTVNKAVTIDEIHAHLKARDRHYAVRLLNAMVGLAFQDKAYAANLSKWLGDDGEYSTVFLRDELCLPFKDATFLDEVKVEGHSYPWDDCWMAIDSSAHEVRLSKFKMIRARFHANHDDPRPLNWPIKHPYWVTGYGDDYSTVVAYADNEEEILANWPEAHNIDVSYTDKYSFTDRFPKPDWFEEKAP